MRPAGLLSETLRFLALSKPAGIATHSPEPGSVWGWQDYWNWRAPELELRVVHRLDRGTSGVLLLAKGSAAAKDLASLWESGRVRKTYEFASRAAPREETWERKDPIEGKAARTSFRHLGKRCGFHRYEAVPLTGRTHQIRIHAKLSGCPIAGDSERGDSRDVWPLLLHARALRFECNGRETAIETPVPARFEARDPMEAWWLHACELREMLRPISSAARWLHGAADRFEGVHLERWNDTWAMNLAAENPPGARWLSEGPLKGKPVVTREYRGSGKVKAPAGSPVEIVEENGLSYEARFEELTTSGLFLDQRENRLRVARFLEAKPKAKSGTEASLLNLFAHTASFSVVAASRGAKTLNVDLSARYLEWGKRHFDRNGLDSTAQGWFRMDARSWLARAAKRPERFDAIILDPPSFSRSKEKGAFQVEKELPGLAAAAFGLLKPNGALLVATNLQKWPFEAFRAKIQSALRGPAEFSSLPLPPDFPYSGKEGLWMKS
ncbi:MAG: class I SAM-dependent methyltransferase, partial [Verrucomicrobiae bacterium]|nr:class I SAM-dependent methyltransferase [Verrucomicrobiae bacterium]